MRHLRLSVFIGALAAGCGDQAPPPPPTQLSLAVAPSSTAQSRVAFGTQPVIQLQDDAGNPVSSAGMVITAAIASGGGAFTGAHTATTDGSGKAAFTGLAIAGTVGVRTIVFTASGLKQASANLTLTAGVPAAASAVAGNNQVAAAGSPVAITPRVQVVDADANAVAGATVTFAISAGGGAITGASVPTDSAGNATVGSWTLGGTAAVNKLDAQVAGVAPVQFVARSWSIASGSGTLTALGATQSVTATVGDSTLTPTLSLVSQSRWLTELAVLDTSALKTGVLKSVGPGRVVVHVKALGLDLADIVEVVAPSEPLIVSIAQPGWPGDPTLVARGYQMNALADTTFRVGGSAATRVAKDSAQFTANPGTGTSSSCVLSVTDSVSTGAVASLVKVTAKRLTAIPPMAVGDTITFQGTSRCLKLPPQKASYAIAQVERTRIDSSVTNIESFFDTTAAHFPLQTSGVADQTASPNAGVRASPGPTLAPVTGVAAGPSHVRAGPSTDPVFARATPWAVGDVFTGSAYSGVEDLRVMRVFGNLVIALAISDSANIWTPTVATRTDSTFPVVIASTLQSLFGKVFPGVTPVTSTGAGQLLIILHSQSPGGAVGCSTAPGGYAAVMYLGPSVLGAPQLNGISLDLLGSVGIVSHELTHTYDCMRTGVTTRWAAEGMAEFVRQEGKNVLQGISPDANVSLNRAWEVPYRGQFQSGYGESGAFMRHLTWRLSSKFGAPYDSVRTAVVQGVSEGWYGQNSTTGPGLNARAQLIAGASWDPVEALLDFVLSVAVDDRAVGAATYYTFPLVKEAWKDAEVFYPGIPALLRGKITAGSGQSTSYASRAGDIGYVLVDDPNGVGTALTLTSSTTTIVWRILRYK